jgi:hypothetical protein
LFAAFTMACGGGGGFPDASTELDAFVGGTLSLDWSLVKMADGSPIACDPIGASSVTLLLRNRAFQGGFTEVFSCSSKMGTTPLIPVGTYDVNFELTGTSGLITTGEEQRGLVVTQNTNTPLQPVTFTVNAVGAFDLRIDSQKAGGNCATIASGGAGISTMSITLTHASGGACEPATISIGGTNYVINCAAPTTVACFEKTVAVTATNLPSDNYLIHVKANQTAASNCFVNDDSIRIPPNGGTLTRTLNLAATGGAGCL